MNFSNRYILKFGGTSVGSPEAISRVFRIIYPLRDIAAVVVVSAFAGVTDALLRLTELSDENEIRALVDALAERHRSTFLALLPGHEPSDELEALLEELSVTSKRLSTDVLDGSLRDYILSFGERLSAAIIAYYCNAAGIRASLLDTRSVVRTDSQFGQAVINIDETYRLIQHYFASHEELCIATGFIGSDRDGRTTTIGRGGSDLTAALFGGALNVAEIQIWTDVSGIFSADPRTFPTAQHFEKLTYEQALSLALAGAKVIHPASVYPAKDKKIPVRIKNTFCPEDDGTIISDAGLESSVLGIRPGA